MIVFFNICILLFANIDKERQLTIGYEVASDTQGIYELLYSEEAFEEGNINVASEKYKDISIEQIISYKIPTATRYIRLDLGNSPAKINIKNVKMKYFWYTENLTEKIFINNLEIKDIDSINLEDNDISILSIGSDPYILYKIDEASILEINKVDDSISYMFKILICILITSLGIVFYKTIPSIKSLSIELMNNKKLIWTLARNDFKTKYAGSYLGIIWAFIQPIVTVLVYWFVFQVGFKAAPVEEFPFVLWLIAGMVPWFFFNDAIMNATNSLIEYNYLVKKVVFKISVLPIVKIISALFVHLFFICFLMIMFIGYGYMPNIYFVQTLYYSLCIFALVLGISYMTSAIIIFLKDLGQIITIFLQVGMWMTPILWDFSIIPETYQWIFKLNPMYYIVEGYRDSLINQVWFWERYNQTIYFWGVTISLFIVGTVMFKRLKPHFADVL
ncbi:ABC transporter permease [Niameybacter massiliensis]|uniref:Transport permease protein n=1 Tax=Holtiella tumoricola TaxID=3018743 RepID=A0AA42J230_9FIRM|nr:ABC transporter permease [Holtiella tumoricola]MDA3733219.1 ABC transporter permease [Holtiella tumoricola]